MSTAVGIAPLEIAYLFCGTLIIILALILGRNRDNQRLYYTTAAIGGVIAIAAIASLLRFNRDPQGKLEVLFERTQKAEEKINRNQEQTSALRSITDDLERKAGQLAQLSEALKEQSNKAAQLSRTIELGVKERTESEAKLNGRMIVVESRLKGSESKLNEMASRANISNVVYANLNVAAVQINSSEDQLDKARKLRDRLTAAGMNATILPTDFAGNPTRYDPRTVNLVYVAEQADQAARVKSIIDQSNVTQDVRHFRQVGELAYAPIQINLW